MKQLFNNHWFFHKEPLHTPIEIFFQRSEWQAVDIPHDWMIYNSEDLYSEGVSCYKKTFFVDNLNSDRLYLLFEGVYMNNTIYLNGKKIFRWPYGYSQFEIDLTDHVKPGENTIFVTNVYELPNSRWYPGSGIYRNVWLIRRPAVHLTTDGIYLSSQKTDSRWALHIDTEIQNDSGAEGIVSLRHTIFSPDGEEIQNTEVRIDAQIGLQTDRQLLFFDSPSLWDIKSPIQYSIHTELLLNDQVIDTDTQRFGFRTIHFDSQKGFFLNGKNVTINGTCEHHTLGALGAAVNREAIRRQLLTMKVMGVNAIRSAHNMPAVELLELCDEIGLLLFTESFDMWEHNKTDYDYGNYFKEWWQKDVTSWVRQDRNHPSVFIWGIGNEIPDVNDERGLEVTCMLRDEVRKLDYYGNAVIAMGSNIMDGQGAQKCANEVDLAGYNYQENLYDEHHKKYPDWCIFGSETSSTLQSRGIYHFPLSNRLLTYADGQCSSLGNCTTNWGAKSTDVVVSAHRDRKYCFGQFIWTGWDYIGEPTPYFTKNSYFGQVDTAGFPKDSYYHYMAEWTSYKQNPMVHLLPYWDFNEGQLIDVRIFSNAPKVELFYNGESQGTQKIDHANGQHLAADWQIVYHPGTLEAVAYDENNTVIAKDTCSSFGNAARITLHANKDTLLGNGEDLLFLEINTVDEQDRFVANSRSRVHVSVTGAGRLIGLDNGDSTDFEQYKGTSRKLFSGRLLAIIATKPEAGSVQIEVTSPTLEPAVLTIPVLSAPVRSGISCFMENEETYPEKSDEIPVRKIELHHQGATHLDKQYNETVVTATILPENATHRDISFQAVTLDGVESNCVTVDIDGTTAVIHALGDGEFRLCCSCTNGRQTAEVMSELEFEVSGLGEATSNPYKMINGINYSKCSSEAKLSFQGGVYITANQRTRFLFENIDFGEYGAADIHIPIFSFEDELPIEVWLGDSETDGICLLKDNYHAKSWYNHYQENIYKLPQRIKGVHSISIVVYPSTKLSLQGFYCTKLEKAYGKLYAIENNSITGDAFTVGSKTITDIGNNVTIEFDHMDFGENGPSHITINGHSPIPVNTIHIRFFREDGTEVRHMVDFPQSDGYQELTFPIDNFSGSGRINFIFMPGSRFDFDWFKFK